MKINRPALVLAPIALAVSALGMVVPAQASTAPPTVANGTCTKGSLSNLQVQREDNGKLSVDFGVDMATHTSGVAWTVKVTDNGTTIYRGRVSTISDGSFSVTKSIAPRAGRNVVVATARNLATGETCRIRAAA